MREAKHPFKYSKDTKQLIGKTVKDVLLLGSDVLIVSEDLQLFKLSVRRYYDDIEIVEVESDYSDVSNQMYTFMKFGLVSFEDYHLFKNERCDIIREEQKKNDEKEIERKRQEYLKLKAMFEPQGDA